MTYNLISNNIILFLSGKIYFSFFTDASKYTNKNSKKVRNNTFSYQNNMILISELCPNKLINLLLLLLQIFYIFIELNIFM